jgi:DNA-binding HxlR family transcriptional regulator
MVLAEEGMLEALGKRPQHRLSVAAIDCVKQGANALLNNRVIHFWPTSSIIELTYSIEFNNATRYDWVMEKTSFAQMRCSLARGLDMIGDWWSPLIIRDLFLNITRFDELVEDLGISRNLLTRRLKSLVKHGVIERVAYQQRPVRYVYRLTEAGRDLVPAILALTAWGDRWARPREGSPILFVHRSCGHLFEPKVTCSACAEVISAEMIKPIPGPGGATKPGTMLVAKRLRAAMPQKPVA